MNDTELDELLDAWTAPPVPASLRENVQAAFAAGHTSWTVARVPRARKRMFAATILILAAFVLLVTQAFPQKASPPVRVPYTVDSEFLSYAEDGSSAVEMYSTSYERDGTEILKSRSIPQRPFETAVGRALDAAIPLWSRLTVRFTVAPEVLEKVRRSAHQSVGAITGCDASCLILEHYGFARAAAGLDAACIDGTIVGNQTIVNYPTTAIRPRMGGSVRMTWWTAPDLGCFALRITTEKKRPDGSFRLVQEKRALRVNWNP
ncbi:MAG TPA: hypothetical protein VN924_27060 [Bryobacteraceae bacterium]|nr:hypothetical protein [Bryobacteraceae bacterium]